MQNYSCADSICLGVTIYCWLFDYGASKAGLPIQSNRQDSRLPIAAFFIDWIVDWIASILSIGLQSMNFHPFFFDCFFLISTLSENLKCSIARQLNPIIYV